MVNSGQHGQQWSIWSSLVNTVNNGQLWSKRSTLVNTVNSDQQWSSLFNTVNKCRYGQLWSTMNKSGQHGQQWLIRSTTVNNGQHGQLRSTMVNTGQTEAQETRTPWHQKGAHVLGQHWSTVANTSQQWSRGSGSPSPDLAGVHANVLSRADNCDPSSTRE